MRVLKNLVCLVLVVLAIPAAIIAAPIVAAIHVATHLAPASPRGLGWRAPPRGVG